MNWDNLSGTKVKKLIGMLEDVDKKKQNVLNVENDFVTKWESIKIQTIDAAKKHIVFPDDWTKTAASRPRADAEGYIKTSYGQKLKTGKPDELKSVSGTYFDMNNFKPNVRSTIKTSSKSNAYDDVIKMESNTKQQTLTVKQRQKQSKHIAQELAQQKADQRRRDLLQTGMNEFVVDQRVRDMERIAQLKKSKTTDLLLRRKKAKDRYGTIAGVGVSTIGVDYGIVDSVITRLLPDAIADKQPQPSFTVPRPPEFKQTQPSDTFSFGQTTPSQTTPNVVPDRLFEKTDPRFDFGSITNVIPKIDSRLDIRTKQGVIPKLTQGPSTIFDIVPRLDVVPRTVPKIKQESIVKTKPIQDTILRPIYVPPPPKRDIVPKFPRPIIAPLPFWLASARKKRKPPKKKKGKKKTIVWQVPKVWFGRYDPEEYKVIGKTAKTPKKFLTGDWGFDTEFT
jgi:hypothetical protein